MNLLDPDYHGPTLTDIALALALICVVVMVAYAVAC